MAGVQAVTGVLAPPPGPLTAGLAWPESLPPDASLGELLKRVTLSLSCESNRRLSTHGLTAPQCIALLRLRDDGKATVGQLARALAIDVGAMTRLLDRLERKHLIVRARALADRRVVHIDLTEEGRTMTTRTCAAIADTVSAHLAGFTREQHQSLRMGLALMLANGEGMRPPGGADAAST